jgi:hypothetical protein
MTSPDALERDHTLTTAVARFNDLRTRDAMAATAADMTLDGPGGSPPLTLPEVLELLALSEVIARKVGYGRQIDVRTARRAGASWAQIGAALGTSKQAAWEAHLRWIDAATERHRRIPFAGFDDEDAEAVRRSAGEDPSAS